MNSTISLIGKRYLDTEWDAKDLRTIDAELQNRGMTGFKRWVLEYLCASCFWWNIIWWEWIDLSEKDLKIGLFSNLITFGLVSAGVYWFSDLNWALFTLLTLHLVTTWQGFGLRNSSNSVD